MSTPPVRFGLLGYGFGGRTFHAPLISSATGAELVGVVTRAPLRLAQLAHEHPDVAAYDSLEQLAAAGADAVSISTPADTHTALARQALRLGLAVVCDKPFALDSAGARETIELAEELSLPLSPYQNRRWDSDFLTVRRLIAQGSLGDISRFDNTFERFTPDPGPGRSGGGSLLDFGAHLFDQALQLFGPVTSVYAEMHVRESGLDDEFFGAVRHSRGVLTHLAASFVQGAPRDRIRLTGSKGSYVAPGPMDSQEFALIARKSPATEGEQWGVEPAERWGTLRRGDRSEPVPSERGRWDSFYPAFAAAVRGEGEVPVDPWDAVASLEVIEAARRSALDGVVVDVPPFRR
ncbi:MAG: Gfo/Idh/MocA family oxidoreductase [Actinomycetota bacterium]